MVEQVGVPAAPWVGDKGAPLVPFRAQQQEQARRPPALTAEQTEPHSAAGAVAAGDHTSSGAEQRARMRAVAIVASAQNGTYARPLGLHACLAWDGTRHAANRRSGAYLVHRGQQLAG